MGGGGGGYSISSGEMDELRRQVERRTQQTIATSEINALLGDELARVNQRDVAKTSEYLEAIREALGDGIDEFETLLFGGSIAKHTYVDGLSDIDSLVVLSGNTLGDMSPAELREQFRQTLISELGTDQVADVKTGNLAVTVIHHDGTEIQLLPAVRHGESVEISSADGKSWKAIEPRRFAEALTDVNKQQRGQVVPAIKLAKAIIAQLPEQQRLAGYHVEALALAAFTDYNGSTTPKEMLTHLFGSAAQGVLRPAPDTTGQSKHIDEELGEAGSSARRERARALEGIANRMRNAASAEDWRRLLGS
ncbi:MAG: CBASS oligonucleotide cyclase [Solirubrobacteraceae bacterium]